ncbi:MAG: M3 family oligoendopeptidase [Erysipelotrichaceae bacterium]|jgi:pepF/M3 family oligoendopeptidase|nr:M3 family oligoendopeptidase [Erysipelotrichaceae bacterium]
MNKGEWNLDVLYPGIDSEAFQSDFKKLGARIEMAQVLADNLEQKSPLETLKSILTFENDLYLLIWRMGTYLSLRQSVNTADSEVVNWLGRYQTLLTGMTGPLTVVDAWISKQNLEELSEQSEQVKEHLFILKEIQENDRYKLSEKEEILAAKLRVNGSSNWEDLQSYLTSTLQVEYRGEKLPLSQVRNLAYSDDATVRKEAYEAELASYEKIKDAVAFSLNSLKGEVNLMSSARGYDSPLAMTLQRSRLKKETLDALWEAIREALPAFQRYLKAKARYLGHFGGLPFYDLFAPLGKAEKRYELQDAKDFIVANFGSFDAELADMAKTAFEENWIDFFPRKNKVGGAFCANMPFVKQSRILTNYDYELGDVITLAHELGHAFHGQQIQDQSILNTDYTMPVAETASTFCETIVKNAALREAGKQEQLKLLDATLCDLTQIVVDIYSRFLFESEVFARRKEEFLFAPMLEEIMVEAQKKAYGEGLDADFLHPFAWIAKSHYYSASLNFYNFPYAYGGLFALGLYNQYRKEGADFVPKYKKLLKATTVASCEDVAMMAGMDVTRKQFWQASLAEVKAMIAQLLPLLGEGG